MSAPDAAVVAGPALRIRGTPYPVLCRVSAIRAFTLPP